MKNYKKIKSSKIVVDTIFCNMCGEKIEKDKFGYEADYLSIEKTWGFGSEYDNNTHNIDICQKCYKKFIDNLKIKP